MHNTELLLQTSKIKGSVGETYLLSKFPAPMFWGQIFLLLELPFRQSVSIFLSSISAYQSSSSKPISIRILKVLGRVLCLGFWQVYSKWFSSSFIGPVWKKIRRIQIWDGNDMKDLKFWKVSVANSPYFGSFVYLFLIYFLAILPGFKY